MQEHELKENKHTSLLPTGRCLIWPAIKSPRNPLVHWGKGVCIIKLESLVFLLL